MVMGSLSKPDPDKKRRINELLKDLSPDVRDLAKKLVSEYQGEDLDKKLTDLIGIEKARKLVKKY
jgi:hypothetical protein